ncbi:hypothetical protein, partial [Lysinibacillus agricola]|uniref:hypothetical protein n=1 Tax=Lysinibacillus agricola TaxID=2590012 RepID=UPI003C136422
SLLLSLVSEALLLQEHEDHGAFIVCWVGESGWVGVVGVRVWVEVHSYSHSSSFIVVCLETFVFNFGL